MYRSRNRHSAKILDESVRKDSANPFVTSVPFFTNIPRSIQLRGTLVRNGLGLKVSRMFRLCFSMFPRSKGFERFKKKS